MNSIRDTLWKLRIPIGGRINNMPTQINPKEFHKSVSAELVALQNRVRNLIGNANWGEDGRYKEAVLRNVIRRFLGSDVIIGTGFVATDSVNGPVVSDQIDILIVNRNYPLLFLEGDFIVTTPLNVLAMIEVKTRLSPTDVAVFHKASENKNLINKSIFNGVFSYEGSTQRTIETAAFEGILAASNGAINHICFGKDFFIKHWDNLPTNPSFNSYGLYRIDDLAFSYFISNLVESIYPNIGRERNWFLYPIEEGKEAHRFKTVNL